MSFSDPGLPAELQQQLDAALQMNTSCTQQLHMLETDLRAAKEREAQLQSAMQELHDNYRDKEVKLAAQVDAAAAAFEAASTDRLQARSREEDMRVECENEVQQCRRTLISVECNLLILLQPRLLQYL